VQYRCLEKVKKDVEVVMKNATGIIIIRKDNKSFQFIQNSNPRLGVLAIIGPADRFEKALLVEVGIGPSRPYHQSSGCRCRKWIAGRKKCFELSRTQYLLVAPFVFDFIKKLARQKVNKWRSGGYFWIKSPKRYWSQRQKKLFRTEVWRQWPKGTRFSFSKKDYFFLADIFWAEMNLNTQIIYELSNLARFIDKRLSRYKNDKYYKGIRPFHRLKGAQDVKECTTRLPSYLKKELLNYLPSGKNNYFYRDLQNFFDLSEDCLPEEILARQAKKLSDPRERLQNIQVKVTSGLNNLNKDYIVVEIFPPPEQLKSSLEDIPF